MQTLATPVDGLATGFDLEAYRRRRRIAAVPGTTEGSWEWQLPRLYQLLAAREFEERCKTWGFGGMLLTRFDGKKFWL